MVGQTDHAEPPAACSPDRNYSVVENLDPDARKFLLDAGRASEPIVITYHGEHAVACRKARKSIGDLRDGHIQFRLVLFRNVVAQEHDQVRLLRIRFGYDPT